MARRDILQFARWLKRQTDRDDPIGDFATDFLADLSTGCADDVRTLSDLDRHLRSVHHASDEVLSARDRAWREYQASR